MMARALWLLYVCLGAGAAALSCGPHGAAQHGSDLQVCLSRNMTCCTKKMEERYQVEARRDLQNLLQTSSSGLKLLFTRNVASFQEAVEALVRQAQNHTLALLHSVYPDVAREAAAPVAELFTDVGLFLLGAELGMEEAVQRFFQALFPPVYKHLLELLPVECVRQSARGVALFGNAASRLASLLWRSAPPTRLFLQALHLGVEVINTTEHLMLSRECRRALLRMTYCPLCQGLSAGRPCTGYCLNVLRGCLADLAEVDAPWREFVRSLEALEGRTVANGGTELERALANMPNLVRDAITHTDHSTRRLSSQVDGVCGSLSRQNKVSVHQPPSHTAAVRQAEKSLTTRRQEFLSNLRVYRAFYGGLADQLCVTDLSSGDTETCWNGADVVKSYTQRVVASGIKAQVQNPEVRVKEADPVISQVIDKLKHVNQLLQGRAIPKLGTLDQIETGSGDGEGTYSGDCDDEDGCWGSGSGKARKPAIKTTKWTAEKHGNHRPNSRGVGRTDSSSTRDVRSDTVVLMVAFTLALWWS